MTKLTLNRNLTPECFSRLFCEVFDTEPSETAEDLSLIWDEVFPFAIENGDEPVSQLLAFPVTHGANKGLYLYAIATDTDYRGKGLMRSLLSQVENFAIDNGYSFTFLIAADSALASAYERLGYCQKISIPASAYPDTPDKISASADLPLYGFDGDYSRLYDGYGLFPCSLEFASKSYPSARVHLTDGGWVLTNDKDYTKILATSLSVCERVRLTGAHCALAKPLAEGAKIPEKICYPLPR